MNPIDQQLQAMIAMIRAAGGHVGFDPTAPDFVKKAFLQMIMECDDCRKEIMGGHDGKAN